MVKIGECISIFNNITKISLRNGLIPEMVSDGKIGPGGGALTYAGDDIASYQNTYH